VQQFPTCGGEEQTGCSNSKVVMARGKMDIENGTKMFGFRSSADLFGFRSSADQLLSDTEECCIGFDIS